MIVSRGLKRNVTTTEPLVCVMLIVVYDGGEFEVLGFASSSWTDVHPSRVVLQVCFSLEYFSSKPCNYKFFALTWSSHYKGLRLVLPVTSRNTEHSIATAKMSKVNKAAALSFAVCYLVHCSRVASLLKAFRLVSITVFLPSILHLFSAYFVFSIKLHAIVFFKQRTVCIMKYGAVP